MWIVRCAFSNQSCVILLLKVIWSWFFCDFSMFCGFFCLFLIFHLCYDQFVIYVLVVTIAIFSNQNFQKIFCLSLFFCFFSHANEYIIYGCICIYRFVWCLCGCFVLLYIVCLCMWNYFSHEHAVAVEIADASFNCCCCCCTGDLDDCSMSVPNASLLCSLKLFSSLRLLILFWAFIASKDGLSNSSN